MPKWLSKALKRYSREKLARNFAGFKAGSANVLTLWSYTVNKGADPLNIWIPAATGTTV